MNLNEFKTVAHGVFEDAIAQASEIPAMTGNCTTSGSLH